MYIHIKDFKVYASIGCYEHERQAKQSILIDIKIKINAPKTDSLDATINYDEIINYMQLLIDKKHFNLVETLTQHILTELLSKFILIDNASIAITKLALFHNIQVKNFIERKHKVALSLGSNSEFLPKQQLINAIEMLADVLDDIIVSDFYETSPVGYIEQNNFYNVVVIGNTTLKPEKLLAKTKVIEKFLCKVEKITNGPRIIDIDIVLYDELVYQQNFLTIPHKDMHNRDFVLIPLASLCPNWQHPVLKQSIAKLAQEIKTKSIIKKLNE